MTDRPEDAITAAHFAQIIRAMAFMENHHLDGTSPILFRSVQDRDTEIAARRAYGNISRPLTWDEAFAMQPALSGGMRRFKNDGFGHTLLSEEDRLIATGQKG